MTSQASPAPATGVGNVSLDISALARVQSIGDLSNKVALITGASSGIGRAMSQAFAAAGAFIVNGDLTPLPPKAAVLEQKQANTGRNFEIPTVDLVNQQFPGTDGRPRMAYVECNVTRAPSIEAAIAFTVQTYGRLDIMVNNAGVTCADKSHDAGADTRTHVTSEETFDQGFEINVKGVWLGTKYATAQMLKQEAHSSGDKGWIINLCSIMGLVSLPGAAIYCATKGAVLQLTKATALEYAQDRIHINCINPGFAETSLLEPMRAAMGDGFYTMLNESHPWGRLATAEDVAMMAVFLAGPGAAFITGAPFVVDGGYIAR